MTTHTQIKPAGTPTWVELFTPDIEAARAFYRDVFGWEYNIGAPEYGGYTTVLRGDRAAAGMAGPQPDTPPMPSAWGLYFASSDIEADVARAVELGAKVLYPPMVVGAFGSMAACEDPTGAQFSFWQAGEHVGAQVMNEPGATAWFELYTPDVKRARDFYTALLGASVEPMLGGPEYYVMKHGDESLCGVMQIDPAWGDFPPSWITYFGVANADEAAAAITNGGGKVLSPIEDTPFGRMAAAMDPSGAQFKIIEI